jgi:hypothetical protein
MLTFKLPLTTKESMIIHSIILRVDTLYSFFVKKSSENPSQQVIDFINKAISSPIQDSECIDDLSHLMGILNKNFLDKTSRELRGIFNPNFKVLEKIGVINNARDPEKVSIEEFPNLAPSLQLFAYKALARSFSMHPQLEECFHLLDIPKLSSNETKEQENNVNHSPR